MIEKKNLLQAVQHLLETQEAVLSLCSQQLGNTAFFSGIVPQGRPEVQAELAAFQALSQQHRQTLEDIMDIILAGERDVY